MSAITKSPDALRTIREVADELGLEPYVLRFWEKEFPQIKPMQRGSGRRYYRPEDVQVIRSIQSLLHEHGYTIKGARAVLDGKDTTAASEKSKIANPVFSELKALQQQVSQMRKNISAIVQE